MSDIFYLLLILFLLLFAWFVHKQPQRGLYLLLLFLPSYQIRFNLFGLPTTLLECLLWLTFICWIAPQLKNLRWSWPKLKTALTNKNNLDNPVSRIWTLPIILFLLASWMAIFSANNYLSALGLWRAYFFEALIFFILVVYLFKQKNYQIAINYLAGLAIVNGLFCAYQYITGDLIPNPFWADELNRRAVGLFAYPNAVSLLFAPLLPLFISQLYEKIKAKNYYFALLLFGATLFSIFSIYWAKSMGAGVALVMTLIIFLFFYKKTRMVALLFVVVLALGVIFTPLKQKIETIYVSTTITRLPINPTSWQTRAQQWRETWLMLKNHPFIGAGLGNYQITVKPFHVNRHIEIFLYPHNIFLNFWTEIGLLGLISFIWLIIVFFKNCQRNYTKNAVLTVGLTGAMIVLLIHGLVDVPYFKNDLALLFWLIVAGSVILKNEK
jgi:O-antigen ligase